MGSFMLNLRKKNKKDKKNKNTFSKDVELENKDYDQDEESEEYDEMYDDETLDYDEQASGYDEEDDSVYENQSGDESDVFDDEEDEAKPWEDYLIYCDNLVKIYKSDEIEVMALQGLELQVKQGEFLSIIGKSGSGKSTLMNLIGGLEDPTLGQIYVNGYNLADMTVKQKNHYRKSVIGFVWQKSERNLLQYLTSYENILNAMSFTKKSKKEKEERVMELLEMVGMTHKKDSLPNQMSGGEQQRIAIAVALANNPKILLADEPTGAVDSKTSNDIQDLFRKLNRELNITIIIVTHDNNLANKVDRVIMISDGKISTEKVMKQEYRQKMATLERDALGEIIDKDKNNSHEEYSLLDKANRVQLSKDILSEAGIDSKKVVISVENGKVVISGK